jgi:hypothetical protein
MTVIGLNELLPITEKVRKIQTGSELLLAYELSKYTQTMLGADFSLADINISKELLTGEHFSFVVTNGLDVGFVPARESLVDYSASARYFFNGTVDGVSFKKVTPEEVVYSFEHNVKANNVLHGENRSAAYISLVAYLMVISYRDGVPMPKLVIDHENYNQQELEYVDLFILLTYGNCLLKDCVEILYSTAWGFQPDWEAFVMQNRQRGLMNDEYTMTEKHRHLKKNFEVGDVVLRYTRSKGAKGKTINKLTSCFPAVIRYFDQTCVRLQYFPLVRTRLTHHMELEEVSRSFEDEKKDSIYNDDDYERFLMPNSQESLVELGVGTCTFTETIFFIKPVDFDGSTQCLRTAEGSDMLWLSTLDTIYAVFEDRGVDYNKEKFLQTHFYSKGRTPVYDEPQYALAR